MAQEDQKVTTLRRTIGVIPWTETKTFRVNAVKHQIPSVDPETGVEKITELGDYFEVAEFNKIRPEIGRRPAEWAYGRGVELPLDRLTHLQDLLQALTELGPEVIRSGEGYV